MAMSDYEDAASLLARNPELADFTGPAPRGLVAQAERTLGLTFPPTYRRFVSEFGAGNFGATEVYGVLRTPRGELGIPDVVWYNLALRRDDHPAELLAFYSLGDGTDLCLDATRVDADGENPVVAVYLGSTNRETIAASFGSVFLGFVREELESEDEQPL